MIQKIQELRSQKVKLVQDMRAHGESVNWIFSSEEDEKRARMQVDLENINRNLSAMEAQLDAERSIGNYGNAASGSAGGSDDEVRRFLNYVRGTEARAMGNTTGYGAEVVPTVLFSSIIDQLRQLGVVRSLATVMPTANAQTDIPLSNALPAAGWYGEGSTIGEGTPTFSSKSLKAKKLATIVKIPTELLADSAFNLESYVSGQVAQAFNLEMENAYLTGTLSTEPAGILPNSTHGLTSSVAAAITTSDITSLFASVGSQYRERGVWLAGDACLVDFLKLADPGGRYIYMPGDITKGIPDTLLGKPLKYSPKMPGATALTGGDKALAFGDFKQYMILDRAGMTAQILSELYAANGYVGLKMEMRTDGALLFADAIKTLKIKA